MPKNKQLEAQIQDRIAQFVQEVDALIRSAAVEAVEEALGGHGSSTGVRRASKARKTGGRKKAKKRGKSAKRVRRSAADVEALGKRVLSHVKATPGQRLGEIAKALRKDTKDVRRPAFMLVEAGSLRTEGQRGGTRYYPGGAKKKAVRKKRAAKKAKTKKKTG